MDIHTYTHFIYNQTTRPRIPKHDTQTDTQTDRQTNKQRKKTNKEKLGL